MPEIDAYRIVKTVQYIKLCIPEEWKLLAEENAHYCNRPVLNVVYNDNGKKSLLLSKVKMFHGILLKKVPNAVSCWCEVFTDFNVQKVQNLEFSIFTK